jgi:hypothetical protein
VKRMIWILGRWKKLISVYWLLDRGWRKTCFFVFLVFSLTYLKLF